MSAQTETPTVTATARTTTGKQVQQLRRQGQLPGILYGNVKENRNLSLDAHTFTKIFREAGYTTLVNLVIDDEKPLKVLIHDVAEDTVRGNLLHVDFFAVNLKEKLSTEVPLQFSGTADAVETLGGTFLTIKDSLEIECLPEDLPQHIEVDISSLKTFEDTIRVKDIATPKGVTVLTDSEEMIASVSEPISEEELAALEQAPDGETATEFETTSGTESTPEEQ